jgi:hypothetical protein
MTLLDDFDYDEGDYGGTSDGEQASSSNAVILVGHASFKTTTHVYSTASRLVSQVLG